MTRGRLSRLRIIWLLLNPLPPSPVTKLDRRHTGRLRKRDNLLTGEGGGGAKSYAGEKTWSSINHSILSDIGRPPQIQLSGPPRLIRKCVGVVIKHISNKAEMKGLCCMCVCALG
jgi:hypothetical protein